jgi:hypothetical protein
MVGGRRLARIVDSDSEEGRQNSGDDIVQHVVGDDDDDEDCHLASVTGDATSQGEGSYKHVILIKT